MTYGSGSVRRILIGAGNFFTGKPLMLTPGGEDGRFKLNTLQLRIQDKKDIVFAPRDDDYYVIGLTLLVKGGGMN